MNQIPFWVFFIPFILIQTHAEEPGVKLALINFLQQLSTSNTNPDFGWNLSSDLCSGSWRGVTCDSRSVFVQKIVLEGLNFTGNLDMNSVCSAKSLTVLSLQNNALRGEIPAEIANCKRLTHFYIARNQFSGILPPSLARLNNLKRLDISYNNFSGGLPDLSKISGLVTFLAQYNHLSGQLPDFDFTNFQQFNVSYNDFSGRIPANGDLFNESSFAGNLGLCGVPLQRPCEPSSSPEKSSGRSSKDQIIMFSGYIILALVFAIFVIYRLFYRKKVKNSDGERKETKESDTKTSNVGSSNYYKGSVTKSEYSLPSSGESRSISSSSLVVLPNSTVKEMRFEDLLKAPAELLGKGRHGSLYKVIFENGNALAVKRIKDCGINREEFHRRMTKMDQVKHPNVLPALAFYCSKEEKLVVYEYQPNGSLFMLLHGNQSKQTFDWSSRLSVAASLAEALAFMHKELYEHGIAHGSLKSSNILLKNDMEPCISEYGLMLEDSQGLASLVHGNGSYDAIGYGQGHGALTFKADIYNFGVILLELLTRKVVVNNGFDLAKWVHSVVREEWTVEVFDKALIAAGACEERMVGLLKVAVQCINESRPPMNQVAKVINKIKEEEERSLVSEAG